MKCMNFLQDYWEYHACYEIPRNYAVWAGIGLLGAVVHRRVCYIHGDIEMHPTEYIGLIGPQGSSKSTCCSFARDRFKEACPDLSVGPSRSSPESIAKIMSDKNFGKAYKDGKGDSFEIRPFAFFINEFKNFVGRSPFDMLTFLTDIYDVKAYDASTIVRGLEYIVNPAINLLCCETPEWIIRNIKGDVISGGFGRRIVYVYETEDPPDRPIPLITPNARSAIERVKARLIECKQVCGQYTFTIPGARHFDLWYRRNSERRRKEGNKMMRGFMKSLHVQLFKLMMLIDSVRDKPNLVFDPELIDEASTYFEDIEVNMQKLWMSSGRNELIVSQQMVIDMLEHEHRWVKEGDLKRMIQNELTPQETFHVLRHLEESDQIIKKPVVFPGEDKPRNAYTTPKLRKEFLKNGSVEEAKRSELDKALETIDKPSTDSHQ